MKHDGSVKGGQLEVGVGGGGAHPGPKDSTPTGSALQNWIALCGRAYGHILIDITQTMPQALLKGHTP